MAGLRQILCGSRSGAADDRPCDNEPPALPFPTVADVRQRDHSSPGPAAATVPNVEARKCLDKLLQWATGDQHTALGKLDNKIGAAGGRDRFRRMT
ncbi:hypothetical protein CO676_32815 [Sinorhizobium sp. BJ1]|nr:hypothetical protein CO676_32815 [Sinorhizobium sp. BJ1]